jgi:hypothetical protein
MDERTVRPRRSWLSLGLRVLVLIGCAPLAATLIVTGSMAAADSSCGDFMCGPELGWFVVAGGVVLLVAALLFAVGWSAAPIYVIGVVFGGGLAIDAMVARRESPDAWIVVVMGVAILALFDLRRQTRGVIAVAAAVLLIETTWLFSPKHPVTSWLVVGMGFVPLLAWSLTRWSDHRTRNPASAPP